MSVGELRTGGRSAAGTCQLTIARAVSGPNPPPDPTPRFLRLLTITRTLIGQATWHAVVERLPACSRTLPSPTPAGSASQPRGQSYIIGLDVGSYIRATSLLLP